MKTKLWRIVVRFPKWVISGSMLFLAFGGLFVWWKFLRLRDGGHNVVHTAPAHQPRRLPGFELGDVLLCGNVLVDGRSGEVIARDWLEGFGERAPEIVKTLPAEKMVLVKSDNGLIRAFDFDGNAKGLLAADGKTVGSAAFSGGFDEVVFVREGNLWRGKVDWVSSRVDEARKLTDVGYFKDDSFRGRWLWTGDTLLVTSLGRLLRVNLATGEVQPDKANLAEIAEGVSPDGAVVLLPVGLREMGVVDLVTGETVEIPTGQKVNRVLWLCSGKAVVQVGQHQIGLYDRETRKLTGLSNAAEPIREMVGASPDGNCFLLAGAKGAGIFDVAAKRFVPFTLPLDQLEWLSPDLLLASCSSRDSEQRGIWLVHRSGETERLMNQPVDKVATNEKRDVPILSNGYFVSSRELWEFVSTTGTVIQKTRDAGLLIPIHSF